MSSMFKKKGGMAFKPKMPQARPRAPGAAVPQPSRAPSSTATEAATETVPVPKDTTVQETFEIGVGAKGSARDQPTTTPPSTEPPSTTQTAVPQAHPPADEPAAAAAATAAASTSEKASEAFIGQQTTRTPATSVESAQRPDADSASVAGTPAQLQTPPATAPSATEVVPTTETQAPNGAEPANAANGGAPNATTEAPAKRPRKRTTQTAENGETGEDGAAAPKPKRPRKQKDPATDGEGAPKRAPRPRKKPTTMTTTEDGAATETDTPRSSSARPRRARSVTPEDAENQEADLSTLTMGDLTRDLRIGKKFSRHDELLQRHREKQARARERLKAKRNGSEDVASESGTPAPTTSGGATPAAVPPPQATSMASTGPQFQIIDGQIVVDQNSLSLDRHAIAAAAAEGEDMLEIEENDFTTLTTQNSYRTGSKLKGPNVWTEEETELFYRGLRMFGTDFQMISGMFPGKNRRHVKMKFNREERHAPARIDAILVGKKELHINLEEYKTWTKAEYEPVEAIMAAQRAQQAKFDAEQAKIKAAKDAINARNLASLQDKGEGGEPAEEESAAGGGGGGGGKPKPRQQQANVGPQITVDADGMITIDETNMDPDAGRGKKRGAGKAKKKAVEYNMRGEIINR